MTRNPLRSALLTRRSAFWTRLSFCEPSHPSNRRSTRPQPNLMRLPDMRRLLPIFVFAIAAMAFDDSSSVLADAKNPTFVDDITPIVKLHCAKCHGADAQKGGLSLATYIELQKGGGSGAIVVPGNPDKSRLFLVTDHRIEPKMPSASQKLAARATRHDQALDRTGCQGKLGKQGQHPRHAQNRHRAEVGGQRPAGRVRRRCRLPAS